jgi:3-hydroxyacyl-CoA dehydrogenase/enoyl-CoA hydratase/3-hydroxybutyryl-CoA epimerase
VRYACDDGIAALTFDAGAGRVNLLDDATRGAFRDALDRALVDASVVGIVIASAQDQFVAGVDLKQLLEPSNRSAAEPYHAVLRRMETGGKPCVAALNGTALGGGAELALACHHRIGATESDARFGFPEVTLGLMPGAGGTQRLPRLIGIEKALPLLLEGRRVAFAEARALGIVDELVPPKELLAAAKRWILERPSSVQPWDRPGFALPGTAVQSPKGQQFFIDAIASLRKKTFGNYPAPPAILASVYHGAQLSIEAGLSIERRNFERIRRTPQAKAMVRTLFFGVKRANRLPARPSGVAPSRIRKIGVLGGGMMGTGIALVSAAAGAEVVLIEQDQALADQAKSRLATALQSGAPELREAVLQRIEATAAYSSLCDAALVIEAVFEDRAVKAEVTKRAERAIPATAIYASNTSTLPISGLAEASVRPKRFIGIHFLSPVERMQLVEIVRGRQTGDEALALALDYVRMIGKTPIVVNDRRGFFTSRVFKAYVREGLMCLRDGVAPALIENAGRMAGMAVGPLAVADEVSMSLAVRIMQQARADQGTEYLPLPADDVFELMVLQLDRPGKRAGRGFYEYPAGGRKYLWPGLREHFPVAGRQPGVDEIKRRLLYAQSLEASRAFEEEVIESSADGDVASILGWGFPAYTGGVFSLIDEIGAARFVAQCDEFSQRLGRRFTPPQVLRDLAVNSRLFSDQRHQEYITA